MNKVWSILLLLLRCSYMGAQTVAERLDALLGEEMLKTSEVGITVFDLTSGESIYQYQDEKLYRPASTQKIVTSVTALALLGKKYTMDTRLCYKGAIHNDTLKGKLCLIGGFDPEFMEEHLDTLVDVVAQTGVKYIDTLVADVSMMDSVYWGAGWSWDDAPHSFQPYLSPLMLNRGCVDITVFPTQKDSLAKIECKPQSDFYRIENKSVCYHSQSGKLEITRNWLEYDNTIVVSGNLERKTTSSISMYPSQNFLMHVFVERLRNKGIDIGKTSFVENPVDSVHTLYTVRRPMNEVLKRALKESDNLCAESMFYHLASRNGKYKRVGADEGSEVIKLFMKEKLGFNPEHYRIVDGSGISLYNYVSPRLLLEYLKYVYYHRDIFQSFYEALPIAGIDGTLKYRMKKTSAYRNVRAKTGSVAGISSLAGYVQTTEGHLLGFVVINQNVMNLKKARDFQDKICSILSQ